MLKAKFTLLVVLLCAVEGFSQQTPVRRVYTGGILTVIPGKQSEIAKSEAETNAALKAGKTLPTPPPPLTEEEKKKATKQDCKDLTVNTADSTVSFSCLFEGSSSGLIGGFDISAKAANGAASLVSKGALSPGGSVGATIGKVVGTRSASFRIGVGSEELSRYDSSLPFGQQAFETRVTEPKADFTFAQSLRASSDSFTFSVGYAKVNNYDQLDEVTVKDIQSGQSGTTTREVSPENVVARIRPLVRSNAIKQKAEYTFNGLGQYSISVFQSSTGAGRKETRSTDVGVGFFKIKDGKSQYGLVAQVKDITQPVRLSGSLGRRFSLGIQYSIF